MLSGFLSVIFFRDLGAKTVFLTKKQLADKYPWMNLDGVDCASLGNQHILLATFIYNFQKHPTQYSALKICIYVF